MAHFSTSAPAASGIFAKLRTALAGLLTSCRREYDIRRTCSALSALSDRELADIGLHRVGIHSFVRERYGKF